METVTYSGKSVQRCTGCHGLWFGSDSFQKLKKDDWLSDHIDTGDRSQGHEHDRLRKVHCPECNARMRHLTDKKQPHILYEECPEGCGVYFDAGEFKDLAQTTFWDRFKSKKILGK